MNAFIFSQFGYCLLVWYNRIKNIHERALRIVYRDYESTLQILATEIFKTKNGLNPVIMEDVFKFKNLAYNS